MLDLHRLQLLHHFAQQGSIAATAQALGYSPSAVSQQLSTLERETGVALLDRTARSAELTVLGRRLAGHAARILEAVEQAEVDLDAHTGAATGPVRIAAVPSAAVAFAPSLAGLRAAHPGLEVVVRQAPPEDALARLRARDVDVAVVDDHGRMDARSTARLHRETLLEDPLVLVTDPGHPLAEEKGPVSLAEAAPGPWICAPAGEPSRAAFDAIMAAAGVRPTTVWEFEGLATIATLVGDGVGIAILPSLALTAPHGERLTRHALPRPASRSILALTRTSSRMRPAIEVTLAALRAAARQLRATA